MMPQLDITWFPAQLFWLAVCFLLLYAIMAKAVVPLTASVLQARKDTITGDLDLAAKFRGQAEKIEAEYQAGLEHTHAEASALIAKAAADAAARAAKKHAALDDDLHGKFREAEKKLAGAREKASGEIAALSSGLALEIVRKLTDIKVEKAQAETAVKQSLN